MQASNKIINIVTRDVSKAFNKVWHEWLTCKIQTQYQLTSLTIKLLSTFLRQRTARIKVNDYEGPAFNLESGSVIGPTLYSIYINGTPKSEPNNLTLMFADDVTKIITTDKARRTGLCNRTLTLRTQREFQKQNQNEREWKIKTDMNKFVIMPVSRRIIHDLVIKRRWIEYRDKARILGLKFIRSGYPRGIEDQVRRASMQVTKLKRLEMQKLKQECIYTNN